MQMCVLQCNPRLVTCVVARCTVIVLVCTVRMYTLMAVWFLSQKDSWKQNIMLLGSTMDYHQKRIIIYIASMSLLKTNNILTLWHIVICVLIDHAFNNLGCISNARDVITLCFQGSELLPCLIIILLWWHFLLLSFLLRCNMVKRKCDYKYRKCLIYFRLWFNTLNQCLTTKSNLN